MSEILIGLDIGTTNLKAVAVGLDGGLIAEASRRTPVKSIAPGSGEHDPEELWSGVCGALQELTSNLGRKHEPIGLAAASMGEAGVPLGASGEALYPFMVWHDVRPRPQMERWGREFGARETYLRVGLPLNPMWSVMKLIWLRENKPKVFSAMRRWLCVEDFAIWRLTGKQVTSHSIACRTMAFNITRRRWDEEILSAAGIPPSILSEPYPSGTIVGEVSAPAAAETGLPEGLPVAAAGHDHLCASLAAGAVLPGFALDSSGTTETIVMTIDKPRFGEEIIEAGFPQGCHVLPDKYVFYAGLRAGAMTLEWLAGILQVDVPTLVAEAEQSPAGAGGVYFMPHLRGGGTSNVDADSTALFFGLTDSADRKDLARAALEGICYEIALKLDFVSEQAGINPERIRTVGGGARSRLWNQLRADITGLPVEVPKVREATACGAALLAGIAVGAFKHWQQAARLIPAEQTFLPDPARHADYRRRLDSTYSRLYPALKALRIQS
jgi:xylulokinase